MLMMLVPSPTKDPTTEAPTFAPVKEGGVDSASVTPHGNSYGNTSSRLPFAYHKVSHKNPGKGTQYHAS
eukprot:scaffold1048_cov90-Amphora_coffeaeformis.AAC.20